MDNAHKDYLLRLRLERMKQRTWLLVVIARLLLLLSIAIVRYF